MMSTIPTTIDDIKSAMFKNRKNAFECLQLFHAQLKPPKKLKSIIENKGNRVTYRCVDEDCSVRISIKSVSRAGQSYWIIYDRGGCYKEEWQHGVYCESVVSLSTRTAAHLLCNQDSCSSRDLIYKARDQGINVGGPQTFDSDITNKHMKAAGRIKHHISAIKNIYLEDHIGKLPALLDTFRFENKGSFASYLVESNFLKSCVVVSQLSISMFTHGYLRNIFAIDCGYWKHPSGKQYKLLLIESTTGNNENCCVAWAIVDGETTANVSWVFNQLTIAGIELNQNTIATITDEGKALLKAISIHKHL